MESFLEYLASANALFKTKQTDDDDAKEKTNDIDVAGALAMVDFYSPKKRETPLYVASDVDVYCYCAAISFLNRSLKQKTKHYLSYGAVKPQASRLLLALMQKPIQNVKAITGHDVKLSLATIIIGPVQFSFHCVEEDEAFNFFKAKDNIVPFDGVSKQCCAVSVLRSAVEASNRYGKTIIEGLSLIDFVENTLDLFRAGFLLIGTNSLIYRASGTAYRRYTVDLPK
jgi:hypothetical protein